METGLVQKNLYATWNQPYLYEYLLVVNLTKEVSDEVTMEKQALFKQFGDKTATKTKPHITIASFLAREAMEETILRYIQRICSEQSAFEVMLNNFSGFPPDTIYIRVQDPQPFKQLAKELKPVREYIRSCSCPPVMLITNPHVTVARSLAEDVYFNALLQYSQKTFHQIFTVNELVLLRRINQFDSCKSINVFQLKPATHSI